MICKYAEIFCWKNVSSFCSAKATHIFSAKNIRILYIESAKTVNEMTLNKLVKLTMLWTTGPWSLSTKQYWYFCLFLKENIYSVLGTHLNHPSMFLLQNKECIYLNTSYCLCHALRQSCRPRWLIWMRCPTGDQEVAGSTPAMVGNISVEIDHEIFSTVILSLLLIQEGQLSVSGERMCTILVNRLED